ncbi:hypothetical protein [Mesorhizobium sp. 113-3-3]|uniref:hypothetical protein n=2 Tax=unclassified Mesorhizobium TaxID=325217 RepID=UPI001925DF8D|nr:hypothetical protein [Mesorhizobium sp. 113-3-3]
MKACRARIIGTRSLVLAAACSLALPFIGTTTAQAKSGDRWQSVDAAVREARRMDKAGMRPTSIDCKLGRGLLIVVKLEYVKSRLPKPFWQFEAGDAARIAEAEKFARSVDMPRTQIKTFRNPSTGEKFYCAIWSREK